jgi:hypothetical protein
MSFEYLASPYSHPDSGTRLGRYFSACAAAARLMLSGRVIYSPIAHTHPISDFMDEHDTDFDFWMRQDLPLLAAASKLVVLRLEGWNKSKGVQTEIKFAEAHGIPIEFIDPR